MNWTRGRGADAVLDHCCDRIKRTGPTRGRDFAVERPRGDCRHDGNGLFPAQPFFIRELSLKISMSYGPGRYDPEYEERGHDYPFGYVRWTENRNIEAFLDLVAQKRVNVEPLDQPSISN